MTGSLRPVFYAIGAMVAVLGLTMFIPGILDLADNNTATADAFFLSGILTTFMGGAVMLAMPPAAKYRQRNWRHCCRMLHWVGRNKG